MDLIKYLGTNILNTLSLLRGNADIVNYSKIEGDEFLQAPESGYYLQSKNETGVISNIRIFFEEHDGFFPSKYKLRGKYLLVKNFDDLNMLLGQPTKDIKPINIPGSTPTLAGKQYIDDTHIVSGYSKNGKNITFLHIKINE